MRRLVITALIAVALSTSVALTLAAPPARAGTPTQLTLANDPLWQGDEEAAVAALMRDLGNGPLIDIPPSTSNWYNPVTSAPVTSSEVSTGISELQLEAGTLPYLMTVGSIAIGGAGAIYTGWQVGQFFRRIIGGEGNPAGSSTIYFWPICAGTGITGQCTSTSGGALTGINGGIPMIGNDTSTTFPYLHDGYFLSTANSASSNDRAWCEPTTATGCNTGVFTGAHNALMEGMRDWILSKGVGKEFTNTTSIATQCSSGTTPMPVGTCHALVISPQGLAKILQFQPDTQSGFNGATNQRSEGGWDPSSQTANVQKVRDRCQNSTDHNIQGACMAIRYYIAPSYDPSTGTNPGTGTGTGTSDFPIYFPQPLPGETVTEYAERLRSKKWLGTISITDHDMSTYPSGSAARQQQPGTLLSVSTATDTATLYDTATGSEVPWPTNPPIIPDQTTAVVLDEVPATWTPEPGAGGGINMPTMNLPDCTTPKFPFAFICWAQAVTGWFNVTPDAPDFDFTIPDQTVGGHTYHVGSHYDVDLNVMDGYMSTFRSILSVVIWVGGIYWLAVKLLGFHPGGDPGEAIDEGIEP